MLRYCAMQALCSFEHTQRSVSFTDTNHSRCGVLYTVKQITNTPQLLYFPQRLTRNANVLEG